MKCRSIILYPHKIAAGHIKHKEDAVPTEFDVRQTKKLFKDFGISEYIPEFNTKSELYNWRDRVIKGFLN